MSDIEKLTPEQEALLPAHREKWLKVALCTDEADWETFEKGINEIYAVSGYSSPVIPIPVIRVSSLRVGACVASLGNALISTIQEMKVEKVHLDEKEDAALDVEEDIKGYVEKMVGDSIDGCLIGSVVRGVYDIALRANNADARYVKMALTFISKEDHIISHSWFGGQFWVSWQAYISFFMEHCGWNPEEDLKRKINAFRMAESSCCAWWPNVNFVVVCDRPSKISRNAATQLHCETGKAIEFRDGWGEYFLNGVKVPAWVVETKAEDVDCQKLLEEKNAEVRRELVRKVGIERVCAKLNAKVIDKSADGVYELLELPIGDEIYQYLKMRNPSVGTYHIEGVTGCKTCRDALDFRKPDEMKKIPVSENGQDWFQQGDVCIWPRNAKFLKPLPKILT